MSQVAASDSDRLRWMVDRHVRPLHDAIGALWRRLLDTDIAAPIDPAMIP
jgi:hypothetical protein